MIKNEVFEWGSTISMQNNQGKLLSTYRLENKIN